MARKKYNFLPVRNEGKIKEYDSCSENEAWSHDPVKRANYFREWIKKNTFKCILPTSLLAKILIGLEAKPKLKIKENQRLCCSCKQCKSLLVFKQMGSKLSEETSDFQQNSAQTKHSGELQVPDNSGEIKTIPILNSNENSSEALMPTKSSSRNKVCCKRSTESKDHCRSDEIFLWNKIANYFPEDVQSNRDDLQFDSTKVASLELIEPSPPPPVSSEPPQSYECNCTVDDPPIEIPEVEKETKTLYCKYCNDRDPEVTRDDNTDAVWQTIQKYVPEAAHVDNRCSCCTSLQEKDEAERRANTISCNTRVDTKKDENIKLDKRSAKCINMLWQKQTKKRTRSKHRKSCNDGDKMSDKPVKSEINIVMKVCSNEFENIAYLQVIHKERKCLPTKKSSKPKSSKGKRENPLKVLIKVRQAFQELIEREVIELSKSKKGMNNTN